MEGKQNFIYAKIFNPYGYYSTLEQSFLLCYKAKVVSCHFQKTRMALLLFTW